MLYDTYEMFMTIKAMDEDDNLQPVSEEDAYDPDLDGAIIDAINFFDEDLDIEPKVDIERERHCNSCTSINIIGIDACSGCAG